MPKNKGSGGKSRRRGKRDTQSQTKRELLIKEDGQEYAQCSKRLGGDWLECFCFDGKIRKCKIRGNMKKRVWIREGDYLLISLRDFENEKADVFHKYNLEEVRALKKQGQLPDRSKMGNESDGEQDDGANFTFEDL